MQTLQQGKPALGLGIYSFPMAARIISQRPVEKKVTARSLRYWLDVGLTPATYGLGAHGSMVLSFYDLVSLEVVRRFREAGASLQLVRATELILREKYPELPRPFAHKIFFTDGVSVWERMNPEGEAVEVLGKRIGQGAFPEYLASFAKEIDYRDGLAAVWHLSPWVEIDPDIHFGAPVVKGTSIPASTIIKNLEAGSPADVADWYGLEVEQVLGVKELLDVA